jgi:hypothetical protein
MSSRKRKPPVPDVLPESSELFEAGRSEHAYDLCWRIVRLVESDQLVPSYASIGALEIAKLLCLERWRAAHAEEDEHGTTT